MPIVKENLILGDGSNLDPVKGEPYIRLARVEEVRLFSQGMIIQFIDGEYDPETQLPIEEPEDAVAVIGSPVPETTYNPSCTVYGKGDLVNVLVGLQGTNYVVSLMDLYIDVNRENFALCEGWALYEALNGVMIDGLDDGENSYITFRKRDMNDFLEHEVIKFTGDPSKRYVFRHILDYFLSEMTNTFTVATTDDPTWLWDTSRSGPDNNPMRHKHGRLHKGKTVCGFPYVEDVDYGQADLTNNLTLYHSTLTDLKTAKPHPLMVSGDVIRRYFEGATVLWFDEEEPTHVVVVGTYPAWGSIQYIVFAEVPVYSMAGRKFLEREIIDEDLPTEERNIIQSWQRYADQVRIIHTIDRSQYIDFLVHDNQLIYSERLTKAAVPFFPTQTGELRDFGILDGYGWVSGSALAGVNKLKRIQGTIERTPKLIDEATEPNGSRYDYEILHNDPSTTGTADLWYGIRFEYEWNAGAEWERQTPTNPGEEFNCYLDGVNSMERTVDFLYYCDGHYSIPDVYGRILWDDSGSGGIGNVQDFDNEFWHRTDRNGGEVWTDHWQMTKTGNEFAGDSTQYMMMYADVEYDLFVMLKIVTHIDPHLGTGPGWTFLEAIGTHWQKHYGIVIFEGVEYQIWNYVIDLVTFPGVWNFFPWTADGSIPMWPGDPDPVGPYSIDETYNCGFCYDPVYEPWLGTLKTGYSTIGFGSPAPYFGPEGMSCWKIIHTDDYAQPDDLLRVSIDYENDSWSVYWESFYVADTNKVLNYPNGALKYAIYSFEGGTVTADAPTVTQTIEL